MLFVIVQQIELTFHKCVLLSFQALVESGREKDKMFRQMQESFAAQQPISASRTAELQNLRDEVDRLQNELLSKEGKVIFCGF